MSEGTVGQHIQGPKFMSHFSGTAEKAMEHILICILKIILVEAAETKSFGSKSGTVRILLEVWEITLFKTKFPFDC